MDSCTTNIVFGMSMQNNQKSTSPTGQISSSHLFPNITQTQEREVQTVQMVF